MSYSKSIFFGKSLYIQAFFSGVLSHSCRIAMLKMIANAGKVSFHEFIEQFPLTKATISEHLRALMSSGLIYVETDGRRNFYRANHEGLRSALGVLEELVRELRGELSSTRS